MQDKQTYIEQMQVLAAQLRKASDAYYNGEEEMSNYEYDRLYDRLSALEEESGIRLPDSPTASVGAEAVDKLEKQKHEYPALSLDKTKDLDKFVAFFRAAEEASAGPETPQEERGETIMWKCDGSTLQLTYEGGKLLSAVTRGNGEIGSVVSHNAPFIRGIPQTIPFAGRLVVRGEAVMSYEEFDRINEQLPLEEQYKNARNLANATITLLDSGEMRQRGIDFFLFRVVACQKDDSLTVNINSFTESMNWMDLLGFQTVPRQSVTWETLGESMTQWEQRAGQFGYPVDGLVVALNNVPWAEAQPGTGHNPHRSVGYAFKWADEAETTVLREIEWSVSRTGLLNPVAIFDPVQLEGTTVSRATLHNVSILMDLDLKIGDRISVYKANKIIPNLADNFDRDPDISGYDLTPERIARHALPTSCPVCGARVEIGPNKLGSGTMVAVCTGPDCPAKKVGSFVNFCSRNCMNLVGTSEKTIERFVNLGILREYADFWSLQEHHDTIVSLEGFGEKAYANMTASAEEAATVDFVRFLSSLGIPGVGRGQTRLLERYLQSVFRTRAEERSSLSVFTALMTLMQEEHDLTAIDGFGSVLAGALYDYFTPELRTDALTGGNDTWLGRLLSCLKFSDVWAENEMEEGSGSSVAGKTFVITGSLNHFDNRGQLQQLLESKGAKVTGSVTKKTDYLINNDTASTTGKNKKAAELGIPVLSEETLLTMLDAEAGAQ